jgi:radical SAM protein with 4Fe4S-binding SPASM domain
MNFTTNLIPDAISIDLVKKIIRGFFNNQGSLLHPETAEYMRKIITPNRILNFISYLFAHRFGIFISDYQPPAVSVEVVRGCNFKCIMCDAWNFKLKFLTFDQVKNILHYFKDSLIFRPYAIGEPFLNKDIYEISRFAYYELGLLVEISSNFSAINPERALNMGAYEIRASIDSINKEKFFEIRHGDFDRVKRNLVEILKLKRKQNKKYPIIFISTVISKLNIDEVEDILNFGISLGVRNFYLYPLIDGNLLSKPHETSLEDILKLRKILDKYEKGIKKIKLLSYRNDIIGYEPGGYCVHAFHNPIIDFRGDVYPCCKVLEDKTSSFGNIFSEPQKVFKNRSLFLRKFRSSPPEFCKRCEAYYRKPNLSFYKNKFKRIIYHKNFLE